MIVLDTNVISELTRNAPDRKVVEWLDRQPRMSIWTTAVTIFELQLGLEKMATGKRRSFLMEKLEKFLEAIGHRVAPFDAAAATQAAQLMAARERRGRPVELRDTMIAGIVLARHATLATRNSSHFDDISAPVVNPWTV